MVDDDREIFFIKHNLQNGFRSHDTLCRLACELKNTASSKIAIDLSAVDLLHQIYFLYLVVFSMNTLSVILLLTQFYSLA